ncbi:permease prefix domain 1-containing protein [Streptomyces sp. HUAS MG47]|uniref:permease prefix domain 1-containing protein n=1 Tax=Streptomyces solicamelliae TaxID=3231716 RepID=UPI003877CF93
MTPGRNVTPDRYALLDAHLTELASVLHGPAKARARLLGELREGLEDATDDLSAHLDRDEAARRAIRDFGTPEELAPGFQRELTIAQARQTARAVLLLVPLLFLCGYAAEFTAGPAAQLAFVPLAGVAALAGLAAAVLLAATGRLSRRLPAPDRLPLFAAWTGTTAATALALSSLTLAVAAAVTSNWPLAAAGAALMAASHAHLASVARTCRRCARLATGA